MSKARVIVLSVVVQGLSKAERARRYGVSWQWVHTLVLRYEAGGLDAGPATIASHLALAGLTAPSTSTIRRILHTAGLITPEPRKRPRSSLRRFAADQPNECWQSAFTHWALADGTDTEILNWVDDHSPMLLSITVFARVTGENVVNSFADNVNRYGPPASTLTDNGSVYTSRFTGGRNGWDCPDPQPPRHRPRPQLLAQQNKRARPLTWEYAGTGIQRNG